MGDVAIRVENLGKRYHIGAKLEKYQTLRDVVTDGLTAPFRKAGKLLRGQASGAAELDEEIWALREVSFEVMRGQVIGIIGSNGAGKSTLLKILSRITEPSEGYADIYGRVGSLLEVGTGFHSELTGRENIYLNGAILGMRRVEIDEKFDEMVSFAGVEKFIDTPVKHYSSGMRLRLGFAVAAHLEPEILLVDEVLAVGDAAFQRKCLGKMESVAREGRTVLFVSHDMRAIIQMCGWTMWLEDGRQKMVGLTPEVVTAYLSSGTETRGVWTASSAVPCSEAQLSSARILSNGAQPTAVIDFDRPFWVEIDYCIGKPIRDLSIACHVLDAQGNIVFESIDTDMPEWKGALREPGEYRSVCEISAPLLKPGRYYVSIVSFVENVKIIERQDRILAFDVSEVGYALNPGRLGIVSPVFEWRIDRIDEARGDAVREAGDRVALHRQAR